MIKFSKVIRTILLSIVLIILFIQLYGDVFSTTMPVLLMAQLMACIGIAFIFFTDHNEYDDWTQVKPKDCDESRRYCNDIKCISGNTTFLGSRYDSSDAVVYKYRCYDCNTTYEIAEVRLRKRL